MYFYMQGFLNYYESKYENTRDIIIRSRVGY